MSRLIFAIVVLGLVGCGSAERAAVNTPISSHGLRESGGAFSATYAGNYRFNGCAPPDGFGRFEARGVGSASFVHASFEHVTIDGNVFNQCSWSGNATITNATHHLNTITMSIVGATLFGRHLPPCDSQKPETWTVTGGTGRFANASGSGTVAFTCQTNGSYTDQWTGTLTF